MLFEMPVCDESRIAVVLSLLFQLTHCLLNLGKDNDSNPTLMNLDFCDSISCEFCKLPVMEWYHVASDILVNIDSGNGSSLDRWQAIKWCNADWLIIALLGTSFNEISIKIQFFSLKNMYLKMLSAEWWPFCSGFNILTLIVLHINTTWVILHGVLSQISWTSNSYPRHPQLISIQCSN